MLHYFCVFQGNNLGESATLVSQTISQFKQKVHYLPWAESIYQAAFCPWSPYQVRPNRISGLTMTNHSVIVNVSAICFNRTIVCFRFYEIFKRSIF